LKIDSNKTGPAAFLIILIAVTVTFGLGAAVLLLGMVLIYFLPSYLVLKRFDIDPTERVFLSFFLGFGIFPVLAYYIGLLVHSFRLAVVLSIFVMMSTAIAVYILKKPKTSLV